MAENECARCGGPISDSAEIETCAYCELEALAFELRMRAIGSHLAHEKLLLERRERNRYRSGGE